jgi:tetratricopeptide (TPR) repeat protein
MGSLHLFTSFVCLLLLLLLPFFQVFALSFSEIVRLGLISLGLLLFMVMGGWKREGYLLAALQNQVHFLVLIFIFSFLQFGGSPFDKEDCLYFFILRFIILVSFCSLFLGGSLKIIPLSRFDRWILIPLAIVFSLAVLIRQMGPGILPPSLFYVRMSDLPFMGILYLIISRFPWLERGNKVAPPFFFKLSILVFGILTISGVIRLFLLNDSYNEGLTSLREREFGLAKEKLEFVRKNNSSLRFSRFADFYIIEEIKKVPIEDLDLSQSEWIAFGEIIEAFSLWDFKASLLETALEKNPADPWILGEMGDVYIELGAWMKAFSVFEQGIEKIPSEAHKWYAAQALVKARQADWNNAADLFNAAVREDPRWTSVESFFSALSEEENLKESDSLGQYIARFNAFELVELGRKFGWEVVSEQLYIGNSDILAPFDIAILSKKADSWIRIGEEKYYSLRGYNLVSIDPQTNTVSPPVRFDIYLGQSPNLANFLRSLPWGTIVLGATEQVSAALDQSAIEELRKIGVIKSSIETEYSHAFVGIKGSEPGTALEIFSQDSYCAIELRESQIAPVSEKERMETLLAEALKTHPGKTVAIYIDSRGKIRGFLRKGA